MRRRPTTLPRSRPWTEPQPRARGRSRPPRSIDGAATTTPGSVPAYAAPYRGSHHNDGTWASARGLCDTGTIFAYNMTYVCIMWWMRCDFRRVAWGGGRSLRAQYMNQADAAALACGRLRRATRPAPRRAARVRTCTLARVHTYISLLLGLPAPKSGLQV
ncbi:uncharacterized protein LOC142978809 [Anticarsia gemmatalis]|uniref:uncharacterized protein LOC142978809 n=1 Tax=Anticarsia gemmatalis TaxID=129554 RepID=UPI003F766B85